MLKAVHTQEDRDAARHKSSLVVVKLRSLRLEAAAKCFQGGRGGNIIVYGNPARALGWDTE